MEHRQLEYFVVLVDERSFSRAAARLFISQPALSQQVQRLEESIGLELIDRSVRPFDLTPAGEHVYVEAQRILESVADILRVSNEAREGTVGRVRVGIAPSLLFGPLPSMLRAFQQQNSGVQLVLERRPTNQLRTSFARRRLDVLLLFAAADLPQSSSVPLYREPFLAALHRDHPLTVQPYVKFSELRDETFVSVPREESPENVDALVSACLSAGFSPSMSNVQGTYLEHIGFVSAGLGVALVPETITRYAATDVVFRPIQEPVMSLDVCLSWRDDPDPVTENLVNFLQDRVRARGAAVPLDPRSTP